jgi:ATP-dependent DNA helicase HFM1/MER3
MIGDNNNNNNNNETLERVDRLIPKKFHSVFPYPYFNQMQCAVLSQILNTDSNIVIAAPTGSGKTVIHELAIIRLLMTTKKKDIKVVFIAPNKALCQQRCSEWLKSFGSLGLIVTEVTGDVDTSKGLQEIAKSSIIITTPEKWDSITRSWRRHLFLLGVIDLLLLDEIHHLGENRGGCLEAVVCRMRILSNTYQEKIKDQTTSINNNIRIIALSATLPNLGDIGEWLNCTPNEIHFFDNDFRPVPLVTHILSYPIQNNIFLFEKSLDDRVQYVIKKYSSDKQTLIFCSSKKGTENLANSLSLKTQIHSNLSIRNSTRFNEMVNHIRDIKLKSLVLRGYGFHHSGIIFYSYILSII